VEQELLTLPEHVHSSLVFDGDYVAQSLVFYVVFCRSSFVLFLLAIVLYCQSGLIRSKVTVISIQFKHINLSAYFNLLYIKY
jgi:hypothetical protein